jgi:hypothetical protein
MTTHIDYDAARERLKAITTDPAALASLELVAKSGELEPEFCEVVTRLNVSLDYIFCNKGEPFLPADACSGAMHLSLGSDRLIRSNSFLWGAHRTHKIQIVSLNANGH